MKILLLTITSIMMCFALFAQTQQEQDSMKVINLEEVIVSTTRAGDKTPVAYQNLDKSKIEELNLGQDMPYMLRMTPSLVTTSDAGAGVGYTGLRIRGSDATRVNITINGIPYNDAESQGTFWVNMPDFASAVNSIQVQRGLGTSTNGAGAFGATVNIETNKPSLEPFAEVNNSVGSFGTRRHNLIVNSGLIDNKWAFEGKLAKIASDGYIDRASSDLQSYFMSGSYIGNKTTIKALVFGGKEVTYQSWYGTPQAVLENDADGIEEVIGNNGLNDLEAENIRNSGRTFNWYTYENEVDNYNQDHYQLHFNHAINTNWSFNLSGHYTYGRGYFEQFRDDDDLSDYGLQPVTIGSETVEESDIIRRRWLDNDFYGFTYGVNYGTRKVNAILGGGYHYYSGDHFGEIIWAEFASDSEIRDRYYDNVGTKKDFNTFFKINVDVSEKFNLFGDLQLRTVDYFTEGVDSDLRNIAVGDDYAFFNPKIGATYTMNANSSIYASFGVGNREPDRNDFVDSPTLPKSEQLQDLEVGYRYTGQNFTFNANFYHMAYNDQLVLTGALNDVGSNIRTNVDRSHRTGIELVGGVQLTDKLNWEGNVTFSQNKIDSFTEVLYDYGEAFDDFIIIENQFNSPDISFSPNVIAASNWSFNPAKALRISLLSKYVGEQFLDNTSSDNRKIDGYFVNDLQFELNLKTKLISEISFNLLINNVLDHEYESNGYTFGYFGGSYTVRENYYYPQAGRNFLLGMKLKF
ncbi:MAG: TonB-dependent receptor [Cyclobacteriaceae bacterium]